MSDPPAIRILLEQESDYSFRLSFPDTELDSLLTDEPAPLGHDSGPNPSRLLLAAIGNCLVASLLFAMRKFKNQPGKMRAEVSASMQRNEENRWRIPHARVALHLSENAEDYVQLDRILAQFEEFCVVSQSVRDGIEVDVAVYDKGGRELGTASA